MIRSLFILSLIMLSACQSNRLVELDYQSGYNFQNVQSWQWAQSAVQFAPDNAENTSDLDAQRVRNAISEQLLQQGLQHSSSGAPIQVRA